MQVPIGSEAAGMFAALTVCLVGNGMDTVIWSDRWIDGVSAAEIAPDIVAAVPWPLARVVQSRMG